MMNSRGEVISAPAPIVAEAIRRAHITKVVGAKNKQGQAGVALLRSGKVRLFLIAQEMEAVMDLLTVQEMETLFNSPEGN